jgi:phosphoenolpyruvate synthase/pyruvate phosphate dikinase
MAVAVAARYVYDFTDGARDMRALLGGKGANLAEMTRVLGPDVVPAGFTITTEACVAYMRAGREEPPGLAEQLAEGIARLERRVGRALGDADDPLLVSVRSGARDSMPGMMDTVLDLGLNDTAVHGLAAATGDERFAWDSYRRFIQMFGNVVRGIPGERHEEILRAARRRAGVREDRHLPVHALRDITARFRALYEAETGERFAASPGAAKGEVVFTAAEAVAAAAHGRDVILARPFTEADDVAGFYAARGILTSEGGKASHAALVARGMGRPAVVGAGELDIDVRARVIRAGDVIVPAGGRIAIDGGTGLVTRDDVPLVEASRSAAFERVLGWADEVRRLGVRANADTPADALKALEQELELVLRLGEVNPMLGTRGCRLGVVHPEIYEMQAEAIMRAARAAAAPPRLEIMIPLVDFAGELVEMRALVERVGERFGMRAGEDYIVGTMIELPRACFVADRLAATAEFFSFGTNDLTQTALGFSRDDVEGGFVSAYLERRIIDRSPFESIDRDGVGALVELAVARGRAQREGIELGVCGEHGGDPDSIAFFHAAGLDYVSCSPFRLPIARVAAAQAALGE